MMAVSERQMSGRVAQNKVFWEKLTSPHELSQKEQQFIWGGKLFSKNLILSHPNVREGLRCPGRLKDSTKSQAWILKVLLVVYGVARLLYGVATSDSMLNQHLSVTRFIYCDAER